MEWTMVSTDQLEQRMLARQAEISRLTHEQILDLEEIDYRQVAPVMDAVPSPSGWADGSMCPPRLPRVWSAPCDGLSIVPI
jgi:hypothetical protein